MSTTTLRAGGAIAVRLVVGLGAFAAIVASASLGAYFGFSVGSHYGWWLGVIFAGAALGGELLKPFAMSAALSAGWRRPTRALLCVAVSVVCIAYSLASELSLAAGSRGDLVAERSAEADAVSDFRAERARLTTELAGIKSSRSVAELEPIVKVARVRCHEVQDMRSQREVCSKDPSLLAELGRAQLRERLQTQLAALDLKRPTGTLKEADPLASTVGYYLTFAGVQIKTPDLSRWLYLIPVAFIEITSAFGTVVYAAVAGTVPAKPNRPKALPRNVPPKGRQSRRKVGPAQSRGTVIAFPSQRDAPKAAMLKQVLAHLSQHGTIPRQGDLVGQFGIPRSTVSRWMGELEAAGEITRTRDGRCTVIRKAATARRPQASGSANRTRIQHGPMVLIALSWCTCFPGVTASRHSARVSASSFGPLADGVAQRGTKAATA
jgi:hypothetical protein